MGSSTIKHPRWGSAAGPMAMMIGAIVVGALTMGAAASDQQPPGSGNRTMESATANTTKVISNGAMTTARLILSIDEEATVTWAPGANDSCVEDVLSRWYETVRNSHFQYSDLTATMFSSRLLYQTLFTLSFDPSSLGKYCILYKSIREESDRCPSSPNKALILNGFALADYFCLERLTDYISTMPCLSKHDQLGTFSECNSQGHCPEYDSAPYVYTNPIELFSYNDTILRMALDCKYLQCDIDCRQPIIMNKCGRTAATFVVDSLSRVFTSISTGLKADRQTRQLWTGFPDDCKRLMHVAKVEPAADLAMNGSAVGGGGSNESSIGSIGGASGLNVSSGTTGITTAPPSGSLSASNLTMAATTRAMSNTIDTTVVTTVKISTVNGNTTTRGLTVGPGTPLAQMIGLNASNETTRNGTAAGATTAASVISITTGAAPKATTSGVRKYEVSFTKVIMCALVIAYKSF